MLVIRAKDTSCKLLEAKELLQIAFNRVLTERELTLSIHGDELYLNCVSPLPERMSGYVMGWADGLEHKYLEEVCRA